MARRGGNTVTLVLLVQWEEEGKGKVVDLLAKDAEADVVCCCQVRQYGSKGSQPGISGPEPGFAGPIEVSP
ncbi:Hypothetical predicted protein [Marmota monax]|uniref:Uncharacterized protein n=1 Tax=Marmota monax TaxID=9995 RepID=A0A5E4D4A5_MARMO|nr:hypothetical protein GHT09_017261 [Marmota monax]VTJ88925.1 Hypothetical predicted protein [Marmota monax]